MARDLARPFRRGGTKLFLPEFTIALLRSTLPPSQAKFHVPLWFSKLDLRDYLWHVYNVEVVGVRSYVKLSRVQSGQPGLIRPVRQRWHRPKSTKFMMVELTQPFVWPEEPEGYKEWSLDDLKESDREQEKQQEVRGSLADAYVNEERRERMREQAKALLEGKASWKRPGNTFDTTFRRGS